MRPVHAPFTQNKEGSPSLLVDHFCRVSAEAGRSRRILRRRSTFDLLQLDPRLTILAKFVQARLIDCPVLAYRPITPFEIAPLHLPIVYHNHLS